MFVPWKRILFGSYELFEYEWMENMLTVTREQIETLVQLQQIDTESRQIRSKLDSLPRKFAELDSQLQEYEKSIAEKSAAFAELQKKYRAQESEAKINQAQIKKSNEKLPSVKTNKEYHAILKEIEELQKKNSAIEDEMLVSLDLMESGSKVLAEQQAESERLKTEIQLEKKDLEQENQQESAKLTVLLENWEAVSKKVPEKLLARFNQVRKQFTGLAIVVVRDAVCQGCHMNIPPQLYNELQRGNTLIFCPWCHRLIYWNGIARSEPSRRSPDQSN